MNQSQREKGWFFGEWTYWPDSRRLVGPMGEQQLPDQLSQMLSFLIEESPRAISRDELLAHVWKNRVVNEEAISRAIAELRKALNDSPKQARYIKTLPKKGYVFVHPIEEVIDRAKRRFLTLVLMVGLLACGIGLWFLSGEKLSNSVKSAMANANKLTSKPGMEKQSQLSSDGTRLTYVYDSTRSSHVIIESLTEDAESFDVTIPGKRLGSPTLVGDQLYFTASDLRSCELMQYELITEQLSVLTDGCVHLSESRGIAWDATAKMLYFVGRDGKGSIGVNRWEKKGEATVITQPGDTADEDWSPGVSPDGKWLSFSRGNRVVRNIWVMNLSTGQSHQVTFGAHYSASHGWLDDEHIIYDSDMNGSRQLWLVNVQDLSVALLGGYGGQHPSVNVERGFLSYQMVDYEANLWQHDISSGQLQRLVHSTKYDNFPAYSPVNDDFVFSSNRHDLGSIWLYQQSDQSERRLLRLDGTKLTRPNWSQDGRHVFITANDKKGYWTLKLSLASGAFERLNFGLPHLDTQEHQDKLYAVAQSDDHMGQLVRLVNGQTTFLPIENVKKFRVLNDGRMVVMTSHNQLQLYDPDHDGIKVLLDWDQTQTINDWAAVGQSVYLDQRGTDPGVWCLSLDTGKLEKISQHRSFAIGGSISVNHTGDKILLSRTDRAESDVFVTRLQ